MLPDMKYYQEFGGEKIIFEKEETAKIKRIIDKGNHYYHTCKVVTLGSLFSLRKITKFNSPIQT